MVFTKVKEKKMYEEVIEQIKELLDSGIVKSGELLPSVEEMSVNMGVSKSTVREAVRVLEALGFVQSVRGKGVIAKEPTYDIAVMDLYDELNKFKESFIYAQELNQLLEPSVAKLAAEKADEQGIKRLEQNLKEMRENIDNKGDMNYREDLSLEFHKTIVEMIQNPLLFEIFMHTREIEKAHRAISFNIPGRDEEIYQEHKNVFEAIKNRRGDDAFYYMQQHVMKVKDSMEKEL